MKKYFKHFIHAFLIAALMLSFLENVQAQITSNITPQVFTDGSKAFYISGSTTARQTYTSDPFSIPEYDDEAWSTYPMVFGAQLSGTSTSTRKISCFIQGSDFKTGTYVNVDTLLTVDSASTPIHKTFNLNGAKYVYWKLVIRGDSTNAAAYNRNTTWKLCIYPYKKD